MSDLWNGSWFSKLGSALDFKRNGKKVGAVSWDAYSGWTAEIFEEGESFSTRYKKFKTSAGAKAYVQKEIGKLIRGGKLT